MSRAKELSELVEAVKKQDIEVRKPDQTKETLKGAFVIGVWAFHKSVLRHEKGWGITHVPSGMLLHTFKKKAEAQKLAELLDAQVKVSWDGKDDYAPQNFLDVIEKVLLDAKVWSK